MQVTRALLLAGLCLACTPEPRLEGSLAEVLDLSFTEVEVVVTEKAFVTVSYSTPLEGGGRNTALRATLAIDGLELEPGVEVNLTPPDGPVRAAASRAVTDDPVQRLPPVKRATATFDSRPAVGEALSGQFRFTFGEGGDAGQGRTVLGTFAVPATKGVSGP